MEKETLAQKTTIAILEKTPNEAIHIAINHFDSRIYLDLRIWQRWNSETAFRPTLKGVSIPLDMFPEFREGITQLLLQTEKLYSSERNTKKTQDQARSFNESSHQFRKR